ncbi:MAG: sensor histidine kinase [Alphaproteobacteria bacterium]|jgi:signal transduction histidine kinase
MAGSRIDMPGFWRGLSARLVVLTIVFVMVAEVLIFVPSISRFRVDYLREKIDASYQATLTIRAAPDGQITPELEAELLGYMGVQSIGLKLESVSYLMLGRPQMVEASYDLSDDSIPVLIIDAVKALFGPDDAIIRVSGTPSQGADDAWIELTVPSGPLKAAMIEFSWRILALSIFISVITAGLVFFALQRMMVRPVQRMTENLISFREAPEDMTRSIEVTRRSDEIGIAQRELAEMERGLRQALRQRARLAAVGAAVSKISHDLRNILATAALVSDRLSMSEDPEVRRQAPVVLASIDRAVKLCQDTLRFARADEPDLSLTRFELAPLADDVANALGESDLAPVNWENDIDASVVIHADRDQLFRILLNLVRNASQAMKGSGGSICVATERGEGATLIDVRDSGSGIPQRAREQLFEAFSEGAQGTGLGLAIARELARAHGGDLELVSSDETGTCFRISLPDRA